MDIKKLTQLAHELFRNISGDEHIANSLESDVRLLIIDCEACSDPTPEELAILTKSYEGLQKRVERAGIVSK